MCSGPYEGGDLSVENPSFFNSDKHIFSCIFNGSLRVELEGVSSVVQGDSNSAQNTFDAGAAFQSQNPWRDKDIIEFCTSLEKIFFIKRPTKSKYFGFNCTVFRA